MKILNLAIVLLITLTSCQQKTEADNESDESMLPGKLNMITTLENTDDSVQIKTDSIKRK
jgi:hypothetical protein